MFRNDTKALISPAQMQMQILFDPHPPKRVFSRRGTCFTIVTMLYEVYDIDSIVEVSSQICISFFLIH